VPRSPTKVTGHHSSPRRLDFQHPAPAHDLSFLCPFGIDELVELPKVERYRGQTKKAGDATAQLSDSSLQVATKVLYSCAGHRQKTSVVLLVFLFLFCLFITDE